jgi:hypothetical protein
MGDQRVPVRKSHIETSLKKLMVSVRRLTSMATVVKMETRAQRKKIA